MTKKEVHEYLMEVATELSALTTDTVVEIKEGKFKGWAFFDHEVQEIMRQVEKTWLEDVEEQRQEEFDQTRANYG